MSKNFLNKSQKKILYKNIGFLFVLTVLCAVLVRSGILTGGETLADLAEKQEQADSASGEYSSADNILPDKTVAEGTDSVLSTSDNTSAENETTNSEHDAASSGNMSGQSVQNDASTEQGSPAQDNITSETGISQQEQAETAANQTPDNQKGAPAMEDRVTYRTGFYYESLSDTVKARITGISYPADDSSAAISYDTLRYLNVLYYDFDGRQQSGELICHKAVAQDLVEIFYELYEAEYPIEKIALVDEYQGDDNLSMQDNNTSCFNYRALPSGRLSNHAYGLAVDINPFYNPYVTYGKNGTVNIAPAGSEAYADREQDFAYKIDEDDLACKLFTEHGFTWGGNWKSSKDYQHFEKTIS